MVEETKKKTIVIIKKKKRKKKKKSKTEKKPFVSQKQKQSVVVNVNTKPVKQLFSKNRSLQPRSMSHFQYQRPLLMENNSARQSSLNNFQNVYGIRLAAIEKGLNGISGNMNNLTNQIQNGKPPPLVRPHGVSVSSQTTKEQGAEIINLSEEERLFYEMRIAAAKVQRNDDDGYVDERETDHEGGGIGSGQSPLNIRYTRNRTLQYSRDVFEKIKNREISEDEAIRLPVSVSYRLNNTNKETEETEELLQQLENEVNNEEN